MAWGGEDEDSAKAQACLATSFPIFIAMAVTIIVGLLVATVLTLVVVPVLYTILFRVPYEGDMPA